MRAYQDIRKEQDRAARKAARENKFPYTPEAHELSDDDQLFEALRSIPFLGDYVAEGWTYVEGWTVDASGFGSPGEPALTQAEFLAKVRERNASNPITGYGIVSAGQFQVFVGVFERDPAAKARRDSSLAETRTGWTL